MKLFKYTFTVLLICTVSCLFIGCGKTEAPEQTTESQSGKPSTESSSEVTLNAVVEAVDYDARTLALKDQHGETHNFQVMNPDVPLQELKEGDDVTMTIYRKELAYVAAPGEELPPNQLISNVNSDKGLITISHIEKTTYTVKAIDLENRMVTLESVEIPEFTIPVRKDFKGLENVHAGDKLQTYITQLITVSINK